MMDKHKRWGNSAMKGHGANSPAMMEARANHAKSKALEKAKNVEGYHRELKDVMKKHSFGPTFVNKPEKAKGEKKVGEVMGLSKSERKYADSAIAHYKKRTGMK